MKFKGINLIVGSYMFIEVFGVESLVYKLKERDNLIEIIRLNEEYLEWRNYIVLLLMEWIIWWNIERCSCNEIKLFFVILRFLGGIFLCLLNNSKVVFWIKGIFGVKGWENGYFNNYCIIS